MRRILILLAASLTVTASIAADPPKPAAKAASTAASSKKTPVMTREELRDCMSRKERLRSQTDATLQAKTDLGAQKAEIERQDRALKDELPALDRTSAEAVNAYNAKLQVRDKLIEDYNARSPGFNAGVEALQADRDAYAKTCENRRFNEDDEDAIKKGQ